MSAPFTASTLLGYKPDEIIKFLVKNVPGLDKKIEKALAVGYTTDQILDFLKKQGDSPKSRKKYEEQYSRPFTDEAGRLTETQRQEKGRKAARKQDFLSETLDPKRLLSAGIGAGVGYATGGPVGAVTGAMGGSEAYDDIIRRYEQHKAEGGSLGLKDFLGSIAKGGAKAAGATALVNTAQDFLKTIGEAPKEEGDQEQDAPTPQQVGSEDVTEEKEVIVPEGLQAQAIDPMEAKASYEVLQKSGIGGILERIQQELSPMEALKLTRKMFGDQSIKDIERERKKPFEQVYEEFRQYQPQESKASVQEQQAESIEEVQGAEKEQPKISRQENPKGWSFQELLGEQQKEGKELKGKARPFESSLKSGNLSAATFDEDTGNMRVVFRSREGRKGGDVYEYENLDLDTFNKMTGGAAKPITEGSNKFGVWFNTKNPSIGAAFDKYIKKNKEQFPYKKVEPKGWSLEESKIVEADRAHLASELFEPFAKKRLEGRQKARAQGLKNIVPALKNMDDDFLFDVVEYLESELKGKLKNEPKVQRLAKEFKKEFQGGK